MSPRSTWPANRVENRLIIVSLLQTQLLVAHLMGSHREFPPVYTTAPGKSSLWHCARQETDIDLPRQTGWGTAYRNWPRQFGGGAAHGSLAIHSPPPNWRG